MSFDLVYRERPPLKVPSGEVQCIVLLHGYGSNELDLLQLGGALNESLHVVSVRAPISIGPQAFAWFNLDWDVSGPIPDQEQALVSRTELVEFLRSVPERFQVAPKLTIGGFSQGAMMSLGVALAAPELVTRVVMMSGRVLPAFVPAEKDERLKGISALVQHGLQDQVLNFQGSRDAAALLTSYGASVSHREYPMAHEISQRSLTDLQSWLASTPGTQ